MVNKTHINNVFDTSTVNIDQEHPNFKKVLETELKLNDSLDQTNNDDSSIVVANTIEHPSSNHGEPNTQGRPKKSIGHYFIGKQSNK